MTLQGSEPTSKTAANPKISEAKRRRKRPQNKITIKRERERERERERKKNTIEKKTRLESDGVSISWRPLHP